jgi:hypothetical protein
MKLNLLTYIKQIFMSKKNKHNISKTKGEAIKPATKNVVTKPTNEPKEIVITDTKKKEKVAEIVTEKPSKKEAKPKQITQHPIYGSETPKETPALIITDITTPVINTIQKYNLDLTLLPTDLHTQMCLFIDMYNEFSSTRNPSLIESLKAINAETETLLNVWLNENSKIKLLAAQAGIEDEELKEEPIITTVPLVQDNVPYQHPVPAHIANHPTSHNDLATEMSNAANHILFEIQHNWRMKHWGFLPIDIIKHEIMGKANHKFNYEFDVIKGTKNATMKVSCKDNDIDSITTEMFQVEQ